MSELVLSASSVDAYQTCHYRWMLAYVEGGQGEQSMEPAIGLAVHAAVEHHFKGIIDESPVTLEDALDVFDLTFLIEISDMVDPSIEPIKARAIGRRVVVAYIEDVAPQRDPMLVEWPGRIAINGIEYSYHIDLVTRQRDVLDLKVKESKPQNASRYLFAMTGYALGFRADTGLIERDVGIDVMVRLKRDRPYLFPLRYGGPISDTDISRFARTLEDTAEGITRGDFDPTGLDSGACRWCPFRRSCDYYAAFVRAGGTNAGGVAETP